MTTDKLGYSKARDLFKGALFIFEEDIGIKHDIPLYEIFRVKIGEEVKLAFASQKEPELVRTFSEEELEKMTFRIDITNTSLIRKRDFFGSIIKVWNKVINQ